MVKVSTKEGGATALELDAVIPPDAAGKFTGRAASALRAMLLDELEQTDLPQSLKNQIASSIEARGMSNGTAEVSLSAAAGDVEFGTRFTAEQPFITRAQIEAQRLLPRLLAEVIQPRSKRAKQNKNGRSS